jgi:hypothetical protein
MQQENMLNFGLVIPRLDRGIQFFYQVLDCPVKPDNDNIKVIHCRVANISLQIFASRTFLLDTVQKLIGQLRKYPLFRT